MNQNGYVIGYARGHGKAVSGTKRTSTVEVREPLPGGYLIKKTFRFRVDDPEGIRAAVQKAEAWADEHPLKA